jgi:hypothetical protein
MAGNCTAAGAGSIGETICNLAVGIGEGVGALFNALAEPAAVFALALGLVAAAVSITKKVSDKATR